MASPPTQPNYSAMDGTEYPAAVDDMTAVNARIAASFACYESSAPAMTVEVNAGHLPATGAAPTIVAAQQETIAAAPAAPNTRVDLIELDPATGTTTVNAGAAGNPGVAPSATSSLQVIAEIAVGSDVMEIVNADITDRRSLYTLEGIAPTAASLAGVGLAVNGAALDLDFSELTTDGSLASTDLLCFYDASPAGSNLVTAENFVDSLGAAQSDQEAATADNRIVTPDVQHHHPSAAKGWCIFDGTAGSITTDADYNVDSITDNGTGDYTVNWATDFSSADYCAQLTTQQLGNASTGWNPTIKQPTPLAAGTTAIEVRSNATLTDVDHICVVAFGDQ